MNENIDFAFAPERIAQLPLGQVRITHGFPSRNDQTLCVLIDGKPVARLPVVECAFEQNYSAGYGHIRLKMIAGDCLVLTSRPRIQHDDTAGAGKVTPA